MSYADIDREAAWDAARFDLTKTRRISGQPVDEDDVPDRADLEDER